MEWELPNWIGWIVGLAEEIMDKHGVLGLLAVIMFIAAIAGLIVALKMRRRAPAKIVLEPPKAKGVPAALEVGGVRFQILVRGHPQPAYRYGDALWVPIDPDEEYAIMVDAAAALQADPRRIMAGVFVDGLTVMEDKIFRNPRLRQEGGVFPNDLEHGYILSRSRPAVHISGKRISCSEVLAFKAAEASRAEAVRLGAQEAVGTIALLLWRDVSGAQEQPDISELLACPTRSFREEGAPTRMSVDVGTIYAERRRSHSRTVTDFVPEPQPSGILVVQYRSTGMLTQLGVRPDENPEVVQPVAKK